MLFAAMNPGLRRGRLFWPSHATASATSSKPNGPPPERQRDREARFFEHLRTLSAYIVFPSRDVFLETLIASKPPPALQNQGQA